MTMAALKHRDLDDLDAVRGRLEALAAVHRGDLGSLVQSVQRELGYLPRNVLEVLAQLTATPLAQLYGVVTFYGSLRLEPLGRTVVRVCHGTACHVLGAERITDSVSKHLGVATGTTSDDLEHTLEAVACVGCCSLAPVMTVNEETHGRLDPQRAVALLAVASFGEDP